MLTDHFGTKSGQRHTNADDSCRLPVISCSEQAWLCRWMAYNWIASRATSLELGWPGAVKKKRTMSCLGKNTFSTKSFENVGDVKMLDANLTMPTCVITI